MKYLNYLILGAIAIVLIVFGRKLLSSGGIIGSSMKLKDGMKDRIDRQKEIFEEIEAEDADLPIEVLDQKSDLLYQSMKGPGTNEEKIFEALEDCSTMDLRKLYYLFNNRKDTAFGWTIFEGDLFGWFEYDLSGKDLEKVKEIFKPTMLWV